MSCVGKKYNAELAVSYKDFMRQNNLRELGDAQVKKWLDSVINNYRFAAPPDEVMRFFKIPDTPENIEWVTARKYTVTGIITNQNNEQGSIMYHLTLEVTESSILLS